MGTHRAQELDRAVHTPPPGLILFSIVKPARDHLSLHYSILGGWERTSWHLPLDHRDRPSDILSKLKEPFSWSRCHLAGCTGRRGGGDMHVCLVLSFSSCERAFFLCVCVCVCLCAGSKSRGVQIPVWIGTHYMRRASTPCKRGGPNI
jgi:hypothetical protein